VQLTRSKTRLLAPVAVQPVTLITRQPRRCPAGKVGGSKIYLLPGRWCSRVACMAIGCRAMDEQEEGKSDVAPIPLILRHRLNATLCRRAPSSPEVAPVHPRRSSMPSITFAMHDRSLRRLSHGSLLFLARGGNTERTLLGDCKDLSEQNDVMNRRVDHWPEPQPRSSQAAASFSSLALPPPCLILWLMSLLRNSQDEAIGGVIIAIPFFPPCARRPSLLDHRRGHRLSMVTLGDMLNIFHVFYRPIRLHAGYCFRAHRA
jgi:hypothetical protein